jgi:hypothetical protein
MINFVKINELWIVKENALGIKFGAITTATLATVFLRLIRDY